MTNSNEVTCPHCGKAFRLDQAGGAYYEIKEIREEPEGLLVSVLFKASGTDGGLIDAVRLESTEEVADGDKFVSRPIKWTPERITARMEAKLSEYVAGKATPSTPPRALAGLIGKRGGA